MQILVVFLFFFAGFQVSAQNQLIAKRKNNTYEFQIDTLQFKKRVSKEIFNNEIEFNKVEVKSVQENDFTYYYLQLQESKQKVKVIRWLLMKDEELFFESNLINQESFNSVFVTCVGDCSPKVLTIEQRKYWSCDGLNTCGIQSQINPDNSGCKQVATSILD